MTSAATPSSATAGGEGGLWRRSAVIAAWVGIAVVVNLVVYYAGRAAGGLFTFTSQGRTIEVDVATVAGFTTVPLLAGLVLMAALGRRLPALFRVAMVGAPTLAVATIAIMTLPAGFDTASTVTLAACHLTLAVISVASLRALRRTIPPMVAAEDATSQVNVAGPGQTGPTERVSP